MGLPGCPIERSVRVLDGKWTLLILRELLEDTRRFSELLRALPGASPTTLTERLRPHWEKRTPEQKQQEIDRTPLRRVAEARDQARVICFLASSDADFVTGVTINVTGGV